MIYLVVVSLIWGLSFGLIKTNLSNINPAAVALIRLCLSLLIFVPLFRFKGLSVKESISLIIIGAIQYGLMYIFYLMSFSFLLAYEVALFTALTPFYVTLFDDLVNRKFRSGFLLTAALAVLGTLVAIWRGSSGIQIGQGFILVQLSNICFASGQIFYRKIMAKAAAASDKNVFALLYLGGSLVALIAFWNAPAGAAIALNGPQILTLLYLGLVASGFCFFLWNYGARQVNAGTLAILNNLKIPLAVLCAVLFFGEKAHLPRLGAGLMLILAALSLNQKESRRWL
jgi:drug/metabolite transporter (DMT)-like permease